MLAHMSCLAPVVLLEIAGGCLVLPPQWCTDMPHNLVVGRNQTGVEEITNFASNRVVTIKSCSGAEGSGDWLRIDIIRADGSRTSSPLKLMGSATVEGARISVVGFHAPIESSDANFLLCAKVVSPT